MSSLMPHFGLIFLNMAKKACGIYSSSAFDTAKGGNEIHKL